MTFAEGLLLDALADSHKMLLGMYERACGALLSFDVPVQEVELILGDVDALEGRLAELRELLRMATEIPA